MPDSNTITDPRKEVSPALKIILFLCLWVVLGELVWDLFQLIGIFHGAILVFGMTVARFGFVVIAYKIVVDWMDAVAQAGTAVSVGRTRPSAPKITCSRCGADVAPRYNFCSECGMRLAGTADAN
jgi:ribosomal protein L37E